MNLIEKMLKSWTENVFYLSV